MQKNVYANVCGIPIEVDMRQSGIDSRGAISYLFYSFKAVPCNSITHCETR